MKKVLASIPLGYARLLNQKKRVGGYSAVFFSVAFFTFAVPLFGTLQPQESQAQDARLITISADGQEYTISTAVVTVGEALERAGIEYSEHDLVEPSPDTEIINSDFNINVYRAHPVTVIDGIKQKSVMTPHTSPRLIARDAGIKTHHEDKYEFERIDNILEAGSIGQRMKIIRSTPITISLYGEKVKHRTHSKTVGDALKEKGIELAKNDIAAPSMESRISSGMKVSVIHVGQDTVTKEEKVPFPTEVIYDNNRFAGEREVKKNGKPGSRLITYKLKLHNGQEVSRTKIQSVVTREPKPEVIIEGTKVPDPGSNAAIGQSLAARRGWTGGEWKCLYDLWMKESNWNHLAVNASSGATGIPQALPGSKMASHGGDWASNPSTQIKWGLDYISGRYGTPCGAWQHSVSYNWY